MRKEIVICDKCKRQLNEGEQFVTRCISSSTYDTRVEDVCMGCAYPDTATTGTDLRFSEMVKIDCKFIPVVNKEFWNIL